MRSFTDMQGRQWNMAITLDAIRRLKGTLGVDLFAMLEGDPPLLTKLATDIGLLCDIIFVIIKPQADASSVTDEQFGSSLGGESIKAALDSFYSELEDFFQKMGRADLAKAVAAQRRVIDLAVAKVTTDIERLNLEALVRDSGKLSMN